MMKKYIKMMKLIKFIIITLYQVVVPPRFNLILLYTYYMEQRKYKLFFEIIPIEFFTMSTLREVLFMVK